MEVEAQESIPNSASIQLTGKERTYRVHVVTWNIGMSEPPDNISSLLYLDSQVTADLYVIGLQEVKARLLQFVMDLVFEDSWSLLFMATLGPLGYVKVTSVRMQGLLLLVFSKQLHLPFIRDLQTTYTRTGIFGYWGNKGGVSARISFYGHALCFLNCHLLAHMSYAAQRVDEFEYILDVQEFDTHNTPHVLDHDLVFWFGDLNFRIDDHGLLFLRAAITSNRFSLLWNKDQLLMMKKKEALLQEFEEGPLYFKPTYKFDRFSQTYDTRAPKMWLGINGKRRKPAWTDRILWRVKPRPKVEEGSKVEEATRKPLREELPLKVALDTYTSDYTYGVSDHKPVIGTFSLELKKKYESPLVRVCAEGDWSATGEPLVTYSILEPFPASSWDWIGLYKASFRSVSDYITYIWVKGIEVSSSDDVIQVYMNKDDIPVLKTDCVLCYYSSNARSIVGISPPFQVHESVMVIEEDLAPMIANGRDGNTAS
ncbi:inositol polyphosphate 5-phosphatase K-like isoform X1 [Brienomyrus brachyistius]|uniref:inositol polyphosphate 5-phosphatase K-like isoform X1 n=1 Tax=Brienomyrus brachyistius TaxID=42636 RepID=UPI0020B24B3F|nr:inositol polyphosphate 5-phosphatase K-like isoform X1 [Brienomyrus brachyistius]